MPTAILKIDGDTSGLSRAFGDIRAQAKATEAAIRSSMTGAFTGAEKAAQRAEGAVRRGGRVARDESARTSQQQERDAQRTVAAFLRAEDQKRRAAQLTAKARERAEQEATTVARAEAQKRGLTAEQEARLRQSTLERVTRAQEAAERRQTATVQRETRERAKMMATVSRGANHVITAGFGAAREAHGQIQDARERRAASEHTLNAAFYQAGVSGAEAQRMRAQIQREVASGSLRGLSTQQVSESIMGAQTEFSVLSQGVTPQMTSAQAEAQRQTNLNRQVELMSLARNTYQDPGEVMRVAGMLGQQGIHGADQRSMLLSLTGMAQAGSIELSTLSSTALGPLMQNLARVTNANMTPEQRAAAVQRTTAETMAVGEIGRAAGLSPRDSINALAKMRGSVVNERTQEKLFSRLTGEHREGLASQLFETDAQGRHRLRNQDPIGLMSSLVTGFGGDANAVSNLLSAGGSAAPMVLDAQQRRLIMGMASQTEGGQTIAQRVSGMQAIGERFGEDDVARGASMVAGETHTTLQANEEQHDNVLTDNTSGVKALSDSIRDWRVRHPWLSGLAQEGGSTLGVSNDAALGVLIGSGVNERRLRSGTTTGGQQLGFGEGVLRTLGVAIPALGAVLGTNDLGSTAQRQPGAALNAPPAGQAAPTVAQVSLTPNDHAAIGQQTAAALRAAPITATVSPVDQAHATAQAPVPTR